MKRVNDMDKISRKKKTGIIIFVSALVLSLALTISLTLLFADDEYIVYPEGGTVESTYTFYHSEDKLVISKENTYKHNLKDKIHSLFR
jgi:hypothetical protein